ncbi:hypothetical protein [uncultured Marinobacter sp.]|uniref:ATP-dependent DNA ligase n=1 Tax=uncultured Marinobacter sp. TaxID=187379 RepID=UPI002592DF2D|nr:hypothetical protein [uncultured Marinobacter sp.]
MNQNHITLYQNHGSAIGYWEAWVEPDGLVMIQYARSLDGKPVLKQYQAYAKNVGKANATTPYEQGVLEIQSKARRKMDKGYVQTLEEAKAPSTNAMGLLKPMLATPFDKVKPEKIEWDRAYAQPKLDGHRALYKDGVLYSRQGKTLKLPHIQDAINRAGIGHMHLDGELYIHGKSLQEISSLVKKYQPESYKVEYHIYDTIDDKPFSHRFNLLKAYEYDWLASLPLKLVETCPISDVEGLMTLHSQFRAEGYEGTMLRHSDEGYQHGKRARTLLKLKEFHDAEFTVVDYEQGKPYITDEGVFNVPVWICDAGNGKTFNVTAPGNMHEKDAQWRGVNSYIGKPLTVKYHYLSKDGIPQLPVALRFREDV